MGQSRGIRRPHVVTLLEGLVGREATTETRVAKVDERTAHLTPQHAHYVREMVDRIVQESEKWCLVPGGTTGIEEGVPSYDNGGWQPPCV